MDKYEKIIFALTIGAVGIVLGIFLIAFYIIWKAVFGA